MPSLEGPAKGLDAAAGRIDVARVDQTADQNAKDGDLGVDALELSCGGQGAPVLGREPLGVESCSFTKLFGSRVQSAQRGGRASFALAGPTRLERGSAAHEQTPGADSPAIELMFYNRTILTPDQHESSEKITSAGAHPASKRTSIHYHLAVKALVIGASGLVGGALLRSLRASGHDVTGTYRGRPAPGLLPLDVGDPARVQRVVADARPDVVFLTAALTAVDYCEDHEEEARAINVEGPRAAGEAGRRVGARLVFYSTEYVFDGSAGPYGEDDPIQPQGAYARSKADGELAVREAIQDHLVLRTTVVFGWDRASKNFGMQVWERLGAAQRMRVPCDQIGNPTLADFLAETSVELVERGVAGETINVVGLDRLPRSDFAVRLAHRLGLDADLIDPVTTAELQQRAPRPLNAGLKTDKLASILGRPAISLDVAIERFLANKATEV